MVVDWSGDLEAVHTDGRVIAVKAAQLNGGSYGGAYANHDHWLVAPNGFLPGNTKSFWCAKNGIVSDHFGWKVRNVMPKDTITPPIPALIAERMRGLIERMAGRAIVEDSRHPFEMCVPVSHYSEAQAIMAELVPVDPDVLIAREIVAQVHIASGYNNHDRTELDAGKLDNESPMRIALTAIRKGRKLEREWSR